MLPMANDAPPDDLDLIDLPGVLNCLRGSASFDELAAAIDNRVSSQTLQRMGDRARPYNERVAIASLIGAADAINTATTQRTTPWVLWVSHGVSFEKHAGLWGRPDGRHTARLATLAPGCESLNTQRRACLNWISSALVAEQAAEDAAKAPARPLARAPHRRRAAQ